MRAVRESLRGAISSVLADVLKSLGPEERVELLSRVAALVDAHVQSERQRCVQHCLHRAEMWRTTGQARSSLASARDEARFRANEAEYLADLLGIDDTSN